MESDRAQNNLKFSEVEFNLILEIFPHDLPMTLL